MNQSKNGSPRPGKVSRQLQVLIAVAVAEERAKTKSNEAVVSYDDILEVMKERFNIVDAKKFKSILSTEMKTLRDDGEIEQAGHQRHAMTAKGLKTVSTVQI